MSIACPLRDSVVVHLWKEVAPTFGRHVEEAPERVGKIAGAMVLFRSGRGKAHLGASEMPDRTVLFPEDVEDCFVPILAVRHCRWNGPWRLRHLE
jgi:hypothetical protein